MPFLLPPPPNLGVLCLRLPKTKCASQLRIPGARKYYLIYFLVTFYFQDNKTQLKECIKPFFPFLSLNTYDPFIYTFNLLDLIH